MLLYSIIEHITYIGGKMKIMISYSRDSIYRDVLNSKNILRMRNLGFILCFMVALILYIGITEVISNPMGYIVHLISPENNTIINQNNNSLQFVYNHTGSLTGVVNCTLYLDGNPVDYSTNVSANTTQTVYSNLSWSEGDHYRYVNYTNGTVIESSLSVGGLGMSYWELWTDSYIVI